LALSLSTALRSRPDRASFWATLHGGYVCMAATPFAMQPERPGRRHCLVLIAGAYTLVGLAQGAATPLVREVLPSGRCVLCRPVPHIGQQQPSCCGRRWGCAALLTTLCHLLVFQRECVDPCREVCPARLYHVVTRENLCGEGNFRWNVAVTLCRPLAHRSRFLAGGGYPNSGLRRRLAGLVPHCPMLPRATTCSTCGGARTPAPTTRRSAPGRTASPIFFRNMTSWKGVDCSPGTYPRTLCTAPSTEC